MPVPRRKLFHLAFQVCWHLNEVIMKAVMEAGKESQADLPVCSRRQQLNSHFFHARPELCAIFVLLFIASVEASASK